MRLHKWVSNSEAVLSSIPSSERAQAEHVLDLDTSTVSMERVLGIQWCTGGDDFQFNVNISPNPSTRRDILSTIASIFDPLGFLAPFVLKGKIILQDLCKQGQEWDTPVEEILLS